MLEALSLTLGDYLTIVATSLIMLWSRPWLAPEAMIIPLFLKVAKARHELENLTKVTTSLTLLTPMML
jgi:hypothetical protein